MQSTGSERPATKTRAIEEALGRMGEPITEAQAKAIAALEDCDCKEGMFALAATRRQLFAGTGLVAAVGMTAMLPRSADAKAPPGAVEYPVPGRSHQGAGPHHGGGRRLRLALAIRDRSALGEPDQDGRDFRRCRTAMAPSRRPGCITSAITAASRTSIRPGTASSSTAWSTGRSSIRSPNSSASRLCRARISWNAPAPPAARS